MSPPEREPWLVRRRAAPRRRARDVNRARGRSVPRRAAALRPRRALALRVHAARRREPPGGGVRARARTCGRSRSTIRRWRPHARGSEVSARTRRERRRYVSLAPWRSSISSSSAADPPARRARPRRAKLGKRVAIVDREGLLGGICLHTGTIPTQDAARGDPLPLRLPPARVLRQATTGQGQITIADLAFRVQTGARARDRGRPRAAQAQRHRDRLRAARASSTRTRSTVETTRARSAGRGRPRPDRVRDAARAQSGRPARRPRIFDSDQLLAGRRRSRST